MSVRLQRGHGKIADGWRGLFFVVVEVENGVELVVGYRSDLNDSVFVEELGMIREDLEVFFWVVAAEVRGNQGWKGLFGDDDRVEDFFHRFDKFERGVYRDGLRGDFFIVRARGIDRCFFQEDREGDAIVADDRCVFFVNTCAVGVRQVLVGVPDGRDFAVDFVVPFYKICRVWVFFTKVPQEYVLDAMCEVADVDAKEKFVALEVFDHLVLQDGHRSDRLKMKSQH